MTATALPPETIHAAYRAAMADPARPVLREDRGSLLDVMLDAFRPTAALPPTRRRRFGGVPAQHCVVWPRWPDPTTYAVARRPSARARSTDTSWLMPRSAMVTPNSRSIRAMVMR